MNTEQAEMIRDIALHIKSVPLCCTGTAVRINKEPICFFGEGYYQDIISKEDRALYAYSMDEAADVLGVTIESIEALVYGDKSDLTGQEYYDRAKVFLDTNGYGDML